MSNRPTRYRTKFTPEQKAQAKAYWLAGRGLSWIEREMGIKAATVNGWRKRDNWEQDLGDELRHTSTTYSQEQIVQARELYLTGLSAREVAEQVGIGAQTIDAWARKYGWENLRGDLNRSTKGLLLSLARVTALKRQNEKTARVAEKLTKSIERLQKLEAARQKGKAGPRNAQAPGQRAAYLNKVLDPEWGLYDHQRAFLQDDARFRCVLKSRQIGFSYVMALDALLTAIGGTDAIIVSASQDQADILIDYACQHAERLGLDVLGGGGSELILGNGRRVLARPANFRTVQGWSGALYLDEFAWVQGAKRLWEAAVPVITAQQGRLTVTSTPYEKGNLFYRIAENVDNRFPRFSRMRVSIDDAIAGGLVIDLDELRDLFDADSFQRLYRLAWFDDEESYFTFDEINACARDCLRATTQAVLYGGLDVGRLRDASEIVLVEPGPWADDGDEDREAVITRVMHSMKRATFDHQIETVRSYLRMYSVRRFLVDATGIGMQLAETLQKEFPNVVQPVWMTRESKEEMAIVLKQMFEKRQIVIPNDQSLIAQINSIKRIPKEKGFSYDSGRNAEIGHADKFWALALACRELGTVGRRIVTAKVY